ncbi:MAG: hypothetical protein IKB70_09255 [Bacilli bacterium]|nr:hypothetical protein [Bacilli bacterium]
MKKLLKSFLLFSLLTSGLVSCNGGELMNNDFRHVYKDIYDDPSNNITNKTIKEAKVFYDEDYIDDFTIELSDKKDIKYEFKSENHLRFVNSSDGYALTLPDKDATFDYSLSLYRTRTTFNDSILTISYEHSSPYGNTKTGWETYLNEWLIRYIDNPKFLEDNSLEYVKPKSKTTNKELNLEIQTFSILIKDNDEISHPYYNISIIRNRKEYIKFYLLVQKSKTNRYDEHINIAKSFRIIDDFGRSYLHTGSLELKENPLWNEETRNYFNKMKNFNTFDFGFFRFSLPGDNEPELRDSTIQKVIDDTKWYKDNMDYDVEILPTYTHLGFYDKDTYFPYMATFNLAQGNGFNNKPVLQYTLQYTRNNNNVSIWNKDNNFTPIYDVIRGKYDDYFRELATQLREYHKPVLFRLNNEMNTDWTSYSGMMSLLDPDIFILGWRRLYDIFNEMKVYNCIWIFNPVADTCPYSSWSEDMCYMPGIDYVQALGVTRYEMLNDGENYLTFAQGYGETSAIYNKNKKTWANYPWIISEFGCGSGGSNSGELYRNQEQQAAWVRQMFDYFSNKENLDCMKRYTGVVWFNCNDVVGDLIENALYIDPVLTDTVAAFKEGFKKIKDKNYL